MDERGQQRPVRGGLVRSESTTVRFPRDWFFATPAARHRGPIWWQSGFGRGRRRHKHMSRWRALCYRDGRVSTCDQSHPRAP